MAMQGKVYEQQDIEAAYVEVTDEAEFKKVEIKINETLVMEFPLPLSCDINEINLRAGNIVHQTGLFDNPVKVIVTEMP